jgi:Ca-activated chloride channel homolog
MKLFKNQAGFNDVITIAIIGGILGSLCILGIFVWKEIETSNTTKPVNKFISKLFDIDKEGKIDDWEFSNKITGEGFLGRGGSFLKNSYGVSSLNAPSPMAEIGFSVGGAKDINSFRENIKNNYLPIPTDITYEGLFYDYYFDTGKKEKCNELFCPSYSFAVSEDPISETVDHYLSVGLNSGIKESDFARKKLNLVVVLDISGSMGSPFNQYYYDQFGNKIDFESEGEKEEDLAKSKMEVASESVVALLNHLNPDDRFGMVLFNDEGYLAKPLNIVADVDMGAIKDHILEISDQGGTNMSAGMKLGTELLEEYSNVDQSQYENRIIFLTDAMPNIGETNEDGLLGITSNNADNNIYSTFIGIGLDFNTELIEYISKVKGANYYSVHSPSQFKTRMDDEFEFMVTPLVFDLVLNLEADGYDIEKVYGSPEANEATGEILKVNTLFPSATEGGETKGGIILLKLKKETDNPSLKLVVSYKNREGKDFENEENIVIDSEDKNIYQNDGIRKAVLLSRYADLMKNWIFDERSYLDNPTRPILWGVTRSIGIMPPIYDPEQFLGKWERQSEPLTVSEHYKELIKDFGKYFEEEKNYLSDDVLDKELELLDKLIE